MCEFCAYLFNLPFEIAHSCWKTGVVEVQQVKPVLAAAVSLLPFSALSLLLVSYTGHLP